MPNFARFLPSDQVTLNLKSTGLGSYSTSGILFIVLPFLLIFLTGGVLIIIREAKSKALIALAMVLITGAVSAFPAVKALVGDPSELVIRGTLVFGDIVFRIDALSGWFILIINLTMITGSIYGIDYMKEYKDQRSDLSLHWILLIVFHLSMLSVCIIQNGLAFLVAWEIMSLSSMLLVIFEHSRPETLRAGLNYLIQMHLSVVFLSLGVAGFYLDTGTFDLASAANLSSSAILPLFALFLAGFALKAGFLVGFIPMHTWLPHAHPAAPSHISGIMSGVMIKIGIFGILRIILLFPLEQSGYLETIGWIFLGISVISGLYGVIQAIVQHNLKKLLAYHSIENIGIIGMGIGLGCIGLGTDNPYVATAGFLSALLHTLNHSLFKPMLFYAAGNVYRVAHTLNLESLGGLFRKIPQTSLLFLLGALAICGLPPFNGFISEFILYIGMYQGILDNNPIGSVLLLLAILCLALIGGLAMLCFTKAFSIVFLGKERSPLPKENRPERAGNLVPLYINGALILAIGLFPVTFINGLKILVSQYIPGSGQEFFETGPAAILQYVSRAAIGLAGLPVLVLLVRRYVTRNTTKRLSPTWACGYEGGSVKMQYTANSFVRMYRKLASPVLFIRRSNVDIREVFPEKARKYTTHPEDALETALINVPIDHIQRFFSLFKFLQNGRIQNYLLYGLIFLMVIGLLSWWKII